MGNRREGAVEEEASKNNEPGGIVEQGGSVFIMVLIKREDFAETVGDWLSRSIRAPTLSSLGQVFVRNLAGCSLPKADDPH